MGTNDRPLVYLAREIVGSAAMSLFHGVLDAGASQGRAVVVINGGQLGKELSSRLYDLVDSSVFQGVISWASSDKDDTIGYYDQFRKTPLVTLSLKIPQGPCILADSYAGMYQAVEHLITVHQKRHIAFIRGPENHVYAQERYQAWKDALKRHGLEVSPRYETTPATWDASEGTKGIQFFLEKQGLKPGVDWDAVVAVNDAIAIGALEELQRREIPVPGTLALTGYNDTKEARCTLPPITSVAMPFREQGMKAVDLILEIAAGHRVDESTKLPARLVLGQSCGCRSLQVEQIHGGDRLAPPRRRKGDRWKFWERTAAEPLVTPMVGSDIAEKISQAVEESLSSPTSTSQVIRSVTKQLHESFLADVSGQAPGQFLQRLSEAIRVLVDNGLPLDVLQSAITALRHHLLPTLVEGACVECAEDLWAQGRVIVGETALRLKESEYIRAVGQEQKLNTLGARLITTFSLTKLIEILREALPKLSIRSFYLVLFEEGGGGFESRHYDRARLVAGFTPSGMVVSGEPIPFASKEFLPPAVWRDRSVSFVVQPLTFGPTLFGYAVFEAGARDGGLYTTLRAQLSSAVYGALIVQENERVNRLIQKTLETMGAEVEKVSQSSEGINRGVQEGSSAMEEAAANIREISKSLQEIQRIAQEAVSISDRAALDVRHLAAGTAKIDQVVQLITDVAERTKVLSFNAAIEAARAGAAGRGFAVVSKEVKELALSTVTSAADITGMVSVIQTGTKETESTIIRVREVINRISQLSTEMARAMIEQDQASTDLARIMVEAAHGTQEIAEALERVKKIRT